MLQQFLTSHSSIQSALPILSDAALKGAILVANCGGCRVPVCASARRRLVTRRGLPR